ncbi:MAG: uracil-DNA glycosylase [Lachnospiraceae bacterium]|nr:uracil-DNA glycosylase [Lachnospiraceae bacterium]
MSAINNHWLAPLEKEFKQPYYKNLYNYVVTEYETNQIFPPKEDIFNAFHYTDLPDVKVVIIGQDPYHDVGQAHGLCFSVKPGVDVPPSLRNMYQELQDDVGFEIPNHGCLTKWAKEGVLLLNNVLTVRAHEPGSHFHHGWEEFTDAAIDILNKEDRPMVFMLWGKPAQNKAKNLNNPKHLILKAPHPSPLSAYRGFFGCKHFSKCNEFLTANGLEPIDWQIDPLP